jgi:NADH:ubiquinone oxidoreductase subunit 5 (subunit L)/multisubunit Na+/H+ antiporter MnhA subunit
MDALVVLIPLLPLMSAIIIAMGYFSGLLHGERGETAITDITAWAIAMSCLLALVLWAADLQGNNSGALNIGQWLSSGSLTIAVNFITTGLNVSLAALFSLLLVIIIHFLIHCSHNGPGHQRLFFVLSLFSSAMLWLVLSGNAVSTFIGWEIAGLCPYLLTAFTNSHTSPQNATRVWVTQLIGDAVFILGTGLSYIWTGSTNWSALNAAAEQLGTGEATGIALCFTIPALAKSAQLPFTPWLERALESPVSASAAIYGVFSRFFNGDL